MDSEGRPFYEGYENEPFGQEIPRALPFGEAPQVGAGCGVLA